MSTESMSQRIELKQIRRDLRDPVQSLTLALAIWVTLASAAVLVALAVG